MKKLILPFLIGVLLITGCAPQAKYISLDVRSDVNKDILTNMGKIAVFPVVQSAQSDSTILINTAFGIAETIERDKGFESNSVNVFSIPKDEFSIISLNDVDKRNQVEYKKQYANQLMLSSGADQHIYIYNFNLGRVNSTNISITEYGDRINNLELPFAVSIEIYSPLIDTLEYSGIFSDTINIQHPYNRSSNTNSNKIITENIVEISKKIGEMIASDFTPQWTTQQRMVITYPDNSNWEDAYQLAASFEWEKAIKIWMSHTKSDNTVKASCAAYNIAIACELTEQYQMAKEWINFALERYRFRELVQLDMHISNLLKTE